VILGCTCTFQHEDSNTKAQHELTINLSMKN
jgi:hypothetical protein